jgi:hypothetical protein
MLFEKISGEYIRYPYKEPFLVLQLLHPEQRGAKRQEATKDVHNPQRKRDVK